MPRLLLILILSTPAWAGVHCGYDQVGGTDNPLGNFSDAVVACVPQYDSTINALYVYTGTAHALQIVAAVYDSDGPSGQPGTLLCQNTTGLSSTAATTFNNIPLTSQCSGVTLTHGHLYWGVENSSLADLKYDAGSIAYYYVKTCCTFDSTFNASPSNAALLQSAYLDLTTVSSGTQCGYTSVGGSETTPAPNFNLVMSSCTPLVAATIDGAFLYTGLPEQHQVVAAIYDSDGPSGKPGTRLCQNTTGLPRTWWHTWNFISLSGCGTLASGHKYYIASNNVTVADFYYDSTGTIYYYSLACCTFDSTFNSSPSSNAVTESAYLSVTPTVVVGKHQGIVTNARIFTHTALGLTPAMGWSPSRAQAAALTQSNVQAEADALVANGMVAAGYTKASTDYNWVGSRDGGTHLLVPSSNYTSMSGMSNYLNGDGMCWMAYLGPGTAGCPASFPGSQGYEQSDANQITDYGACALKYDNCTAFGSNALAQTAYATLDIALALTGKQVYYDVSVADAGLGTNFGAPGWASSVGGNDVWTDYDPVSGMTFTILQNEIDNQFTNSYPPLNTPGRFNMIDLLGVCGDTSLTTTEAQSNFALFALMKSPLFATGDFTGGDATCTAAVTMLTNAEIIAVNQDPLGTGATRVSQTSCGSSTCDIYAVPLNGEGNATYGLVLWNRASTTQNITVTFVALPGSPGSSYYVRDLIAHSNLLGSPASTTYTFNSIASHGVAMLALCTMQCSTL